MVACDCALGGSDWLLGLLEFFGVKVGHLSETDDLAQNHKRQSSASTKQKSLSAKRLEFVSPTFE
jgi:hypothetical protein